MKLQNEITNQLESVGIDSQTIPEIMDHWDAYYMMKNKMIDQPSDIFKADEYYRLNVKPDHFDGQTTVDENELKKLQKTKVTQQAFNQALNEGSADIEGDDIYAVGKDGFFAIIKMNKEVK